MSLKTNISVDAIEVAKAGVLIEQIFTKEIATLSGLNRVALVLLVEVLKSGGKVIVKEYTEEELIAWLISKGFITSFHFKGEENG
jgi:hypothetical protein